MPAGQRTYHYYRRPPDAEHGYPYLVFDTGGTLHLPLTVFAKDASDRLAPASVTKYLTSILPWFTWLETDPWQVRAGRRWDDAPEAVRGVVREYLVRQLGCQVRERSAGYATLTVADAAVNQVRLFLVGLKLFYRIARQHGYYHQAHPLTEAVTDLGRVADEHLASHDGRPPMPAVSGVDAPRRDRRLTDSYFIVVGDQWVPQVVTDPFLCQRILASGRALQAQGKPWGLREECVVCLLFETGARVSEVLGLTLDD